jgi:autotransporter-associated beta strand protein/T5SS/PEP-CTERM-associated repeat protein
MNKLSYPKVSSVGVAGGSAKPKKILFRPAAVIVALISAIGLVAGSANAQLLHLYQYNLGTGFTNDTVGGADGTLEGASANTFLTANRAMFTANVASGLSSGVPTSGMMLPGSVVSSISSAFAVEQWVQIISGSANDIQFAFSDGTGPNSLVANPADTFNGNPHGHAYAGVNGSYVDVYNQTTNSAGSYSLGDNTLHQLVVTYDGTNLSYYLDGKFQQSGIKAGINLSARTSIGIAGGSPWTVNDLSMYGTNYSFRIYGQGLTSVQVSQLYAAGDNATASAIANALLPPTAYLWNGGGANNNWSSGLNWVGGTAPATSGNSVTFAGSVRTSPNLDANYSVSGLAFSNNASSFTIGTANASTLTLAGDVINNSANPQTLNVPLSLSLGATLNAASGNLIVNSNILLGASLALAGSGNFTLNGNLTGSGSFTKVGTGTLTLGGAVSASLVSFNDGTTTVSGAVSGTGGNPSYIGYLTGNGIVNMSGGTWNVGGEIRVGGSDQGGSDVIGTGAFNISGSGTVNASALTLARGYSSDNTVSGTLTLNSGCTFISTNDVLVQYAGAGFGNLVINGGTFIIGPTAASIFTVGYYDSGSGELDITNGNLYLENNSPINMCRGNNNLGANVINQAGGNITFYSDAGVNVGGTGVLDLNLAGGGSDSYNLNGGILTVPRIVASSLGGSTTFNFNGGTLKPTASTATFMQGLSIAYVMAGGAIIDTTNFNITIAQTLQDGGGGLTKSGSGTLTLAGGYSYSGPTIILAGTLSLDASQSSSSSSALIVSNATLALALNNGASSIYAAGVTLSGTNTLNFNFGTAAQPSARAIDATGYSVSNTGTNTINIAGSSLQIGQYPLIYTGGSVPTNNFKLGTIPIGVIAVLVNSGSSLDLLVTASGQSLTWYGADASGNPLTTWNINTSSNWNFGNAKYLQYSGNSYGDYVTFDDTLFNPSDANITLNSQVVPAGVNFNNSSTPYSITGSGGIGGSTAVTIGNNGSVFLGTSNSYSGGTLINNATLIVTNDNALGAAAAPLTLNGGTLVISNSTTGIRGISVTASSTLVIGSNALVQLSGAVTNSASLTFGVATNATLQLSGPVSGSGGITNNDVGTVALSGTNSLGGNLLVNAGTVSVTGGSTKLAATTPSSIGYEAGAGAMNVAGTFTALGNVWVGGADVTGSATGTLNITSGNAYFGGPAGNTPHFGDGSLAIAASQDNVSSCSGTMTVSGGTAWSTNDMIVGYAGMGTGTLNISGSGTVNVGPGVVKWLMLGKWDTSSGIINISGGNLNLMNNTAIKFTAGNTSTSGTNVINQNGGTITFYSDAGTTVGGTGDLNLQQSGSATANNTYNLNGGTLIVPQIGSALSTGTRAFNFNGGSLKAAAANANFINLGTGNAVANVRNNGAIIDSDGFNINVAQALVHSTIAGDNATDGGLTKLGSGTLYLDGANTYTGNTVVSNGVLAGIGSIASPIIVNTNGQIGAGDAGATVGTLTINNNLTIQGGAFLRINKTGGSPTSDHITGLGTANYGGTLTISNVTADATPLVAGDTFTLFSAATHNGHFTNIAGSPGSGLAYAFTNGVLSVVTGVASNSTNITFNVSGNTLSLSWPADHLGWILQRQTNSLTVGLSTNWVDVAGSASITSTNITINPATPTAFYRLRSP